MKTFIKYAAMLVFLLAIGLNKTFAQADISDATIVQPEIENLIGLTISDKFADRLKDFKGVNLDASQFLENDNQVVENAESDVFSTETSANRDGNDDPVVDKEEILIRMGRGDVRIIYDDPNINLYPNPAVDFVNYDLTEEYDKIEIYNLIGSLVVQIDLAENFDTQINLSELNAGIYMINFIGEDKVSSKKLAIRK